MPLAKSLPGDFELGLHFEKLIALVDDHEFPMCLFASGDDFAAPGTYCQANPRQAEGCQRRLSGLAADPVSGGLARLELSRKKRNAAQAEYHRLAASV
ncbi:hypothetical protein SAMN05216330_11178 [Bradyrhizobium sp. Ghvi]|uniref:hypothetical protein n=1 Tax=Bradyrhizobium sp. Ghvi TaxID=1855319 RepID=UPI0008EE1625|nr:hypothetical protein [Bradyrhizobium sp. Ghvi]SFP86801.1 hypothetical protein SAMN05216330_11178 [Bradyrhizobium sp. Ghvi]